MLYSMRNSGRMASSSAQLNTPRPTLISSRVLAVFWARGRSPSPIVLPVSTAAALATPITDTKASWLSTLAMELAATNTLPMRPMMAAVMEKPTPHSSSLPKTGRLCCA